MSTEEGEVLLGARSRWPPCLAWASVPAMLLVRTTGCAARRRSPASNQTSNLGRGRVRKGQGSMGRRQMPSVDDQVQHLTKKLKLSDDQQAKAETHPRRPAQTDGSIREDSSLSRQDRFGKMQDDAAKLRHSDQERAERRSAEELRQDARRAAGPDEAVARRRQCSSSTS